jgi:hypothetical protein
MVQQEEVSRSWINFRARPKPAPIPQFHLATCPPTVWLEQSSVRCTGTELPMWGRLRRAENPTSLGPGAQATLAGPGNPGDSER